MSPQSTLEAVRALSEGRVKLPTVSTVPFINGRALSPRAPQPNLSTLEQLGADVPNLVSSALRNGLCHIAPVATPPLVDTGRILGKAFNDFLETKPAPFTSRQLLDRLPEFGWKPTQAARTTVARLCRQMRIAGVLEIEDGSGTAHDPFSYTVAPQPLNHSSPVHRPAADTGERRPVAQAVSESSLVTSGAARAPVCPQRAINLSLAGARLRPT